MCVYACGSTCNVQSVCSVDMYTTCMYVCMYVCRYVCIYVSMYLCMYVYVYAYIIRGYPHVSVPVTPNVARTIFHGSLDPVPKTRCQKYGPELPCTLNPYLLHLIYLVTRAIIRYCSSSGEVGEIFFFPSLDADEQFAPSPSCSEPFN